ncbi:unnamed protein product [Polarella glacialis]|uniref:WDR19 first beta-propeller domain-containing protein n=1 Tax=Polarella glacialis TaxID=89957 RepID=A0A813FI92_POLGL|nr:unnamed protein product [Polarella glacialis]
MALHIFRLKDKTLHKMIAAHERAISAICWSPEDSNLLASCSVGSRIAIWDIENEEELHAVKITDVPLLMDWASSGDKVAFATDTGHIMLWEYKVQKQTKLFSVAAKSVKVLRWHPRNANKLIVGLEDGSLTVYDQQTAKKLQIVGKAKTSKDAVTDAQWDPLSDDYLLVSFADGSLTLYDASNQKEIHSFDKQSQGINSMAWAKAQPGNFVTVTDRVGVLRLWNVSQRAPLAQIKVGLAGVNCVKAIPSEPNQFVLSFKNSSVGVCDIETRTMKFMSSPGHAETIFDVAFHPQDPDMLATASYDGHLKVWQISTSETHRDMFAGKDMLLYGLAFGPGAAKICAVSSTGFLLIWKLDNGEQLVRQQLHTGQAYRCEWSSKGAGQIATGGADGIACVVDPATGNSVNRIVHPQPVYGVAWHPSQEGILATGCQDGHVRIFNLLQAPGTVDPKAQVVMKGHEARVFNIVFHPVCPNIIASGSDDKTIRIWNWSPTFTGQRELRKLTGHTSHVRGLLWNTELPHILFTGSWDSTIRVWDVAESRCLYVSHDHHADVYGLSLHPRRPFFLVSSSRDTTIRFWIFEDIVRPLLVQALLHPESLSDLLGDSVQEASLAMESPVGQVPVPKKLFGKASRALATELQTLGAARPVSLQAYQKLLNFFMYRQGMEDLWGLVSQIRGETLPSAPGAHRSFFHEREMVACQKSKALELASTRAQIGIAGKQEERLLKAAQIMCRVGDLRAYCRLTAQAGHWERAICIAPAVSHQFWQELCAEYMDTLSAATDTEEVAPFLVGIGRASRLVDSYIERSELDSAFVVAKADCDGLLPCASSSSASSAPPPPPNPSARARLEDVAGVLAQRHLEQGEPLQAAMCFLAVSQPSRAVRTLARAQEVMLAFALSDLLGEPQDPVFLKLISQCAERDDRLELAAEILQMHPQGPSVHLPLLAARAKDQAGVRPWAPWTVEQHQERLAAALEVGDRPAAVLSAVCGGPATHTQAVQLGVEGLCELFARPGGWSLCEARALLDPLESVAIQDMGVKEIASSLACAAYVGLVEASMMGLHELMFPLAQTLRNIITHQNLQFPVSTAEISLLEASCTSHRAPAQALQQLTSLLEGSDLPPNLRAACEQQAAALRQRAPADEWPDVDGPGLAMMAGGHLPACYKRFAKTSVLTNQRIKGPAFQLEDRKMHVSLSDALAWARVNAFSPLNTGCKIYPI